MCVTYEHKEFTSLLFNEFVILFHFLTEQFTFSFIICEIVVSIC